MRYNAGKQDTDAPIQSSRSRNSMANTVASPHVNPPDFDELLHSVRAWPTADRLRLAQAILKTVETDVRPTPRRKIPAAEAEGLLSGPWPTPSDEDVKRLVDEYLSERYG